MKALTLAGQWCPKGYWIESEGKRTKDGRVYVRLRTDRPPSPQDPLTIRIGALTDEEYKALKEELKRMGIWVDPRKVIKTKEGQVVRVEGKRRTPDISQTKVPTPRQKTPDTSQTSEGEPTEPTDRMAKLESRIEAIEGLLSVLIKTLSAGQAKPAEAEAKLPEIDYEKLWKEFNKAITTVSMEIEAIGRRIVMNPHIMLYYAFARSQLDFGGTIDDFITMCIVNYFRHFGVELTFLIGMRPRRKVAG